MTTTTDTTISLTGTAEALRLVRVVNQYRRSRDDWRFCDAKLGEAIDRDAATSVTTRWSNKRADAYTLAADFSRILWATYGIDSDYIDNVDNVWPLFATASWKV